MVPTTNTTTITTTAAITTTTARAFRYSRIIELRKSGTNFVFRVGIHQGIVPTARVKISLNGFFLSHEISRLEVNSGAFSNNKLIVCCRDIRIFQ